MNSSSNPFHHHFDDFFYHPDSFFPHTWLEADSGLPFPQEVLRMESALSKQPFPQWQDLTTTSHIPKFEFVADPQEAIVRTVTPGLAKENLEVRIEGRNLIVAGGTQKEESGSGFHRRSYEHFSRSWTLPPEVGANHVHAEYNNGVLEIRLPKSGNAIEPQSRALPITSGPQKSHASSRRLVSHV
mmetsp:Transcript_6966/g.15986  ORF Transcript_6966/g.15986 Transcript_6966/m.15986 type:complete len:185 (-) Transcript_6966:89-643(-)